MRLHAALGASTSEASELGAAFTKALDIAESLGHSEYQLRALRGLYSLSQRERSISCCAAVRAKVLCSNSSRIGGERSVVRRAHDGSGQAFSWRPEHCASPSRASSD